MTRTFDGIGRRIGPRLASWPAIGAALLLAACATTPSRTVVPDASFDPIARVDPRLVATPVGPGQAPPLPPAYGGGPELPFGEVPFERGALAAVAREGGFVETFNLVPCHGGRAVCGGSESGPAGTLSRTADFLVVQGLYGRTFWLANGGEGYVQRGSVLWSLAWNARVDGREPGLSDVLTGRPLRPETGEDAALETGAPHN
jgi:hypothetical protein